MPLPSLRPDPLWFPTRTPKERPMPDLIDQANTQWNTAGTTKRHWIVAAIAFICGFLLGAVLL